MRRPFCHIPIAFLVLLVFAVVVPAQSGGSLNKHARRIYHRLAKYPQGKYLHLVMSNATDLYGALGTLSAASFSFTNSDSNTKASYAYGEVARVRTDKEPIGEGSEPRRHIRHLLPIAITAAAVGAGAGIYEVER